MVATLSLLLHLSGLWLGAQLNRQGAAAPDGVPAVAHSVALVELPPVAAPGTATPVRLRPARAGQAAWQVARTALDSLERAEAGNKGRGRAAARPLQIAGAADRAMQTRLRNHLQRNSLARVARDPRRRSSSRDNRARARARAAKSRARRQRRSRKGARGSAPTKAAETSLVDAASSVQPVAAKRQASAVAASAARAAPRVAAVPSRPSETAHSRRQAPGAAEPLDSSARAVARRVDLMELAPALDDGHARGAGQGSAAGRRGNPEGGELDGPVWINTVDQRYLDYFRKLHGRVQPLWRFPADLVQRMEQGDVLVRFTILSDGQLDEIEVLKSSGYRRFDRNVVGAIRSAAPFDPVPSALGQRLVVLAPFEFANPLVR